MQEKDPYGIDAASGGSKLDAGKAPVVQGALNYFPDALAAISLLSEAGAKKYSWYGWRSVPDGFNRYTNAMGRHLLKEGQHLYDDGPGGTDMLHCIQTAWNALARLQLLLEANPDLPIKKPHKE